MISCVFVNKLLTYPTLFLSAFLQISGVCRVSWTKRLVRAWTWRCREWTETSAKFSPTSSPPWGRRSSTSTETLYAARFCCSALRGRTPSSSRSVYFCFLAVFTLVACWCLWWSLQKKKLFSCAGVEFWCVCCVLWSDWRCWEKITPHMRN